MLLKNYFINENTILLTGIHGHHGQLQTLVIETGKTFRVNNTAEQILNNSLKKMGTTLRGALDHAKANLGNMNMCPIKMNSQVGLYLFPSKSPKRPDCVWFSLIHVKGAKGLGKNKTKVLLSHGHSIIVDCTLASFKTKLHRAFKLRKMIAENEHCPITFYLEPKSGKIIRESEQKDLNLLNDDQKDISSGQNEN
jgi:competence protein ComK